MNENTTTSRPADAGQLLQQLQAMLAQTQPPASPPPFCGPVAPSQPAGLPVLHGRYAANPAAPTGLLVAVTIPTPQGDVSAYVQLGPDAAANPQGVIAHLVAQGWPVRAYQPREFGWGQSGRRFGRSWR